MCSHLNKLGLKEGLKKGLEQDEECLDCEERVIHMVGTSCRRRWYGDCVLVVDDLEYRGGKLDGHVGECLFCGKTYATYH